MCSNLCERIKGSNFIQIDKYKYRWNIQVVIIVKNFEVFLQYYSVLYSHVGDPNNCLQLRESSVLSGATTLTTLMNETTEMNDG